MMPMLVHTCRREVFLFHFTDRGQPEIIIASFSSQLELFILYILSDPSFVYLLVKMVFIRLVTIYRCMYSFL